MHIRIQVYTVYTLMHSYIVSDPYCLLYYIWPAFFLLGMSVVGPLEKALYEQPLDSSQRGDDSVLIASRFTWKTCWPGD